MTQNDDFPTTEQPNEELNVESDGVVVALRKVHTPNGERLTVQNDARGSTRLDALELESLTWQDAEFFRELVNGEYNYQSVGPSPREPAQLQIGNEYTVIHLSIIDSGRAAEITSPKMGYGTLVDAHALIELINKPKTFFSELLETPYGPEDSDHDHVI